MKRTLNLLLCAALCMSLVCPAFAAGRQTELEAAAAYMRDHNIMVGDQNGSLNLTSGLNRAELAIILTRLTDKIGSVAKNAAYYRTICPFTDVPEWAMPFAGYCAEKQLMAGYGNKLFGPNDSVTPAMACTVVMRACGIADGGENIWNYNTACSYAVSKGLLDSNTAQATTITRGEMAVLIYRALNGVSQGSISSAPQGVGDGYLTNGKPVTEENVLELLHQIEQDWPTDTIWGTSKTPNTHKNEVPSTTSGRIMQSYHVSNVYGCGAYASMVSSLIFGDAANPGRKLNNLDELRPGDIVFVTSPDGKVGHVVIALESPNSEGRFHYTDGNSGGAISWPDKTYANLRSYSLTGFNGGRIPHHLEVWTRYPENVPYTGTSVEVWPTI